MPLYRNTLQSPWRRTEKPPVPPGGVFEPTPFELDCILRRGYSHLVEVPAAEIVAVPRAARKDKSVAPVDEAAAALRAAGWPLRMKPERYLRLYPEGPHAELAQAVLLEAETEEVEASEQEEEEVEASAQEEQEGDSVVGEAETEAAVT